MSAEGVKDVAELGRCDFAIVIPSFNQGAFLRTAIDSVCDQAGVQVDYSVADGGSTDCSVEILESYGDRLRWSSGPDGGQVAAINDGLKRATADFAGYLNSDDQLAENALAKVKAVFEADPSIDVVYGAAWFIDDRGNRVRPYPTGNFSIELLSQHCLICQPAAFWRRRVHDRFGWFDPGFDNTFDYEFWLRLAVGGAKFVHIPEFLACSREHPETKSQRNRGRIFAEIRRMQMKHLGYVGRNWWEQQLRYWRDESCSPWGRLLPGKRGQRMYRLAWLPYVLWRRRLGGPLFYRPGHWRA